MIEDQIGVLNELGVANNTDKGTSYLYEGVRFPGNNYLVHYEKVFVKLRHQPIMLMELGVGHLHNHGRSLRMWDEYFTHPDSKIIGVDIGEYATQHKGGRIDIEIGDCGSAVFLSALAEKYRPNVIIDDASHMWAHQIVAFEVLFKSLLPGGIYIVEDIHTSFGDIRNTYGTHGEVDAFQHMMAYLSRLVGLFQDNPLIARLDSMGDPVSPEIISQIEHMIAIRRAIIVEKSM